MSSPKGPPAAAPSAPSHAPSKKWLIFCALLVALTGVGLVAYRRSSQGAAPLATPAKPAAEPGVLELEPFIVNLADPAGDRYLKLNLRLVLDRREVAQRAAQGLAASKLRDRIFSLLSKRRAAELATVDGKERLRTEIGVEAELLLAGAPFHASESGETPARVLDVLFTEFLLQ